MSKMDRKIRRAFEKATPNVLDSVLGQCPKGTDFNSKPQRIPFARVMYLGTAAALIALVIGIGILGYSILNSQGNPSLSQTPTDYVDTPGILATGSDATEPAPVPPLTADFNSPLALTDTEAAQYALKAVEISFPDLCKVNVPQVSVLARHEAGDEISQLPYYTMNIVLGEDIFRFGIDIYGNICEFQWRNHPEWEGIIQAPSLINKFDAWKVASDFFNTLGYGTVFTLDHVEDLEILLQYPDNMGYAPTELFYICFRWAERNFSAYVDAHTGKLVSVRYDEVSDAPISEDAAIQIAMGAFGCPQDKIQLIKTDWHEAGGSPTWFVNICCATRDHRCTIHAITGEIISIQNVDIIPNDIGDLKAQEIVLQDLGIDRSLLDITYERCFGTEVERPYYKFWIKYNGTNYYYYIDAVTGEFLTSEMLQPDSPTGIIPQWQAIKNAFHAVGCFKDQASNLTCQYFTNEYTAPCYIIGFDFDYTNHSFVLSAYTGEIINYYAYPLPHQTKPDISPELEQEIITAFRNSHANCDCTHSVDYFGQYGNVHVAFVWGDNYIDAIYTDSIGGYDFIYSNGNRLLAYKDGELMDLRKAYDAGWFTADDIRELYDFYKDQKAYLYTEIHPD